MAEPFLSLPIPLLQLVHLHLLQYPLANNPEYDQNLFNTNMRGLRDRTKSMEDICYFLVGKVEGRKESAKSILPMYPCDAPAETTAFRTSLSKYLENLRYSAIHPKTVSANALSSEMGKTTENTTDTLDAWWWKDVVVRKSLLEECAGERFERLLLSLSTHALAKHTNPSLSISLDAAFANSSLLRTTPQQYISQLNTFQSTRRTWKRSGSLLQQRANDIQTLRDTLAHLSGSAPSKYSSLSADRLKALSDSKCYVLTQGAFEDSDGHRAFVKLVELSGLRSTGVDTAPLPFFGVSSKIEDVEIPTLLTQSLPIAAAHHPSNLRKLKAPVFFASENAIGDNPSTLPDGVMTKSHAGVLLSEQLAAEVQMRDSLKDALARTRRLGEGLCQKLRELKKNAMLPSNHNTLLEEDGGNSIMHRLAFHEKPTPELLQSVIGHTPTPSDDLESRIDRVCETRPPISESPPHSPQSRLPQSSYRQAVLTIAASASTGGIPSSVTVEELPRTPRQLITSTPPRSIKPRSDYARRMLASQSKASSKGKGKVQFAVPSPSVFGKSKKGVRTSLAASRPSLFDLPLSDDDDDLGSDDKYGDDVDQIVNAVQDESTSSVQNSLVTPKITRLPSPRKLKSASPFKKTNFFGTPGSAPRPSFKIIERVSLAPLPDEMNSADDLRHEIHDSGGQIQDAEWSDEDVAVDQGHDDSEDDSLYEGVSVTLRDILLKAGDTTQLDLIGEAELDLPDRSFGWG